MLTLTAAGQPSTTMTLRRIQLAKMARDIGGDLSTSQSGDAVVKRLND